MKRYTKLEQLPIFQNVRPQTLQKMQEQGKFISMKKGFSCYKAAQRQENVFILMDGQAIIYTLTHCGNRKIIFIHGSGELLNESIVSNDKVTVFCDLICDSRLFVIQNRLFLRLMEEDFSLVKTVMQIQERKLWRTSHQLKNTLGSIYLEKKLAAKLWKLARDFGTPIEGSHDKAIRINISLSITFLADLLGAPRETTSRICRNLTEKGFIRIEKKNIIVNSMDGLAEFYKN
ncbi:MAG: Crp/Fnr family transcriptional regulator [Lachnospiraceae bacterium]|nr:Crp/Fnr family transcriptional regulator [Lachnospiraceae bacterium]